MKGKLSLNATIMPSFRGPRERRMPSWALPLSLYVSKTCSSTSDGRRGEEGDLQQHKWRQERNVWVRLWCLSESNNKLTLKTKRGNKKIEAVRSKWIKWVLWNHMQGKFIYYNKTRPICQSKQKYFSVTQ